MKDDEINNITQRLHKIKIKTGDSYYQSLLQKYNIAELPDEPVAEEYKQEEYSKVLDILAWIEEIEMDCEPTNKNIDELIEYSLAKTMQYKRKINFDPDHPVNKEVSPEAAELHMEIGDLIYKNVPLLKDNKICKHRKIRNIRKLNQKIIQFVDKIDEDSLKEKEDMKNITVRIRKIKIKK